MCSIQVKNLGFSEIIVLAEVGNKALEHTFDVINPSILLRPGSSVGRPLACESRGPRFDPGLRQLSV